MSKAADVFGAMRKHMTKNQGSFILYVVLRLIVIACAAMALFSGNFEALFLCLLTLVLFLIPSFVEVTFNITIPETLEVIVILFIFAAEILGEMFHFYTLIPFWDTILHTLNGFLAAAIGLALVSILNGSDRVAFSLSPFFCVIVAFCFSMTIGVLWEFFEFGMDFVFGLDMQKDTVVHSLASSLLDSSGSQHPYAINGIETTSVNGEPLGIVGYLDLGLIDTMEDLLVNFVGALTFSFVGYAYLKHKGKDSFATRFVPVLSSEGGTSRACDLGMRESDGDLRHAPYDAAEECKTDARRVRRGAVLEADAEDSFDTRTV